MAAEKSESTRNLLDEIEGEWDSPKPGSSERKVPVALQAELDAAADRLVESLDPPPVSDPALDTLDSGWDEDDEEDEEEEEPEPELPDERLDPAAYALAKKAREERIEAKLQRRRAKAEAKKARRKARLDATKQKQKGKQRKARAPQKVDPSKAARDARRAAAKVARPRLEEGAAAAEDTYLPDVADVPRARKPSPNKIAKKPMLSGTNQWMLAVAVIIFIAAAIFAAVLAR